MGYWLAKKLVESHAATQGQTPEEQIPACLASFLVVDLLWNPTWACQSTNSRVVKKNLYFTTSKVILSIISTHFIIHLIS